MKKFTFTGGIHPPDNKTLTNKKTIEVLSPPQVLYFPLNQHIGAPLTPCVNVGDHVKMYQKIADSDVFVCAPLHSSVSGTVKDIKLYPHPTGTMMNTIIIENDGLDESDFPINTKKLEDLSTQEIINIVRSAGIVGMGGAAFPTHVKLSVPPDKKIDHIIINGAECEPYLTSDHRVMLENPDSIIFGIQTVLKIFKDAKAYIAIEENKPDAINTLKKSVSTLNKIDVVKLKKKYPQGSEKHLIYAVTKKRVPSGKLPADVGCIVLNIDTTVAIAEAVQKGIPLIRRIVTVSGSAINTPANFKARIGTPLSHLTEAAGGMSDDAEKIILGGPMMGKAIDSIDYPVLKNTSALLLFDKTEAHLPQESPCIRCGKCVSACPMNLVPLDLYIFSKSENIEELKKNNVRDCIECGSCSYICPAKRQLVQQIRTGKQALLKKIAAEKENANG